MKKVLCFAAAALTLFAACQKTTVVYDNSEPQEIAVFAVNKTATKAPVSGTAFPEDYNMNIAAYLAAGGEQSGDYFNGTVFSLKDDGTYFTGGRYWPISASTLNFLAVAQPVTESSPYTGSVSVTFGESSKDFAKKATVTLTNNQTSQPAEDQTSGKYNQFDLMYAAGQAKSTTNNGTGSYGEVGLVFAHALSWINFTVAKNDVAAEITVNSIKLNGAYYGGILTLTNNNYSTAEADQTKGTAVPNTANTTAAWSLTNQTAVNNVFVPNGGADSDDTEDSDTYVEQNNSATANATSVVLSTTTTAFGNGLLVVPNNYASGTPPSFVINYTIDQDANEETTNDINTFDFTYTFPTNTNWEMAKKYTYNITINLQEIKVRPSVTEWTTTDESDIPVGGVAQNN